MQGRYGHVGSSMRGMAGLTRIAASSWAGVSCARMLFHARVEGIGPFSPSADFFNASYYNVANSSVHSAARMNHQCVTPPTRVINNVCIHVSHRDSLRMVKLEHSRREQGSRTCRVELRNALHLMHLPDNARGRSRAHCRAKGCHHWHLSPKDRRPPLYTRSTPCLLDRGILYH